MRARGIIAVAAIVAGATACAYGPTDGMPTAECHATTTGPSGPTDGSGLAAVRQTPMLVVVGGVVWTMCDATPQSHVMDLQLWFRPEGTADVETWYLISDRKGMIRKPGPMPTPNAITGPCVPGDYQLKYTITGVSSQGEPFVASGQGYRATMTAHDCGLG